MAKKGQKFNKFSDAFKEQVVSDYFNNLGGVKISGKKYSIPYQTITNWVQKRKKGIDIKSKNHLKGKRKEENINYKERYEILKNYQTFLKTQREKK